jgi:hypothetical protein
VIGAGWLTLLVDHHKGVWFDLGAIDRLFLAREPTDSELINGRGASEPEVEGDQTVREVTRDTVVDLGIVCPIRDDFDDGTEAVAGSSRRSRRGQRV